jgi:hypothetical protein
MAAAPQYRAHPPLAASLADQRTSAALFKWPAFAAPKIAWNPEGAMR